MAGEKNCFVYTTGELFDSLLRDIDEALAEVTTNQLGEVEPPHEEAALATEGLALCSRVARERRHERRRTVLLHPPVQIDA